MNKLQGSDIDADSLIELIEKELEGLRTYHKAKAINFARHTNPNLTEEDLLNPDDFKEIMKDPAFVYEDGISAGVMSAKILVRSLLIKVLKVNK